MENPITDDDYDEEEIGVAGQVSGLRATLRVNSNEEQRRQRRRKQKHSEELQVSFELALVGQQ